MQVNKLPTLTWNFLKLNYVEAEEPESGFDSEGIKVDIKNVPEGVEITGSYP